MPISDQRAIIERLRPVLQKSATQNLIKDFHPLFLLHHLSFVLGMMALPHMFKKLEQGSGKRLPMIIDGPEGLWRLARELEC